MMKRLLPPRTSFPVFNPPQSFMKLLNSCSTEMICSTELIYRLPNSVRVRGFVLLSKIG